MLLHNFSHPITDAQQALTGAASDKMCTHRTKSICRWMPILRNPEDARFNDVLVVEAQRDDGGPACRCQTDDMGSAIFPAKMRAPGLGARIEKRNEGLGEGVTGVGAGTFEFVAAIAGRTEVFLGVTATQNAGGDVINNQGHCDQTPGRSAILATPASPIKDLLAQERRQPSHRQCTGMSLRAGTGKPRQRSSDQA